jgi:hypothetical protein
MRSASVALAALHREGRTQRDTLVKLAAVTPLLVGAITFALLWNGSTSRDTVSSSALCSLLLGYAGIAPGLIAGERERGTLGFLARTPRALRAAFLAKLLALVVAPLAIGAFGAVCAMAIRAVISAGAPTAFFGWTEGFVVLGLLTALWTLPLGALLRSGLVLPAGLLLAAALFVPLGLRLEAPRMGGVLIALCAVAVAAIFSGWIALNGSQRNGGRLLHSAACAALPLVVLVPGLHAWADASTPRNQPGVSRVPRIHQTSLEEAFLGPEGKELFINVVPLGAERYSSLVIDLQTGEVQREEEGSFYMNLGVFDRTQIISGSFGRHSWLVHARYDDRTQVVFDARTGATLGARPWGVQASVDPELDGWMRQAKRETTPWRDAQGRRLWFQNGRGEVETMDGEIEVLETRQAARFMANSGQVSLIDGNSVSRPWDHMRWRAVPVLGPRRTYLGALPAGWLTETESAWEVLDPETALATLRLPRSARDSGRLRWRRMHALPDGQALIFEQDAETRRADLTLLDPAQVKLRELSVSGIDAGEIRGIEHGGYFFCVARDERDRLLVMVRLKHTCRLGRIDPAKATLEVLSCVESREGESYLHAIASAGPDEVLVLTARRIVRASFATDRCTVLYELNQP